MRQWRAYRALACSIQSTFLVSYLVGSPVVEAGSYRFVTLDAGGSYETELYGINNNGVVTGIAFNANFDGTGVIFNGGVPTFVSAPGAVDTEFYQVNNAGQIATSYFGSDGIYHAAVFDSATLPGPIFPTYQVISREPGGRHQQPRSGPRRPFPIAAYGGVGWSWNGSHYTYFSAPGADPRNWERRPIASMTSDRASAISRIASGVIHGYLKTGPVFTALDAPGCGRNDFR